MASPPDTGFTPTKDLCEACRVHPVVVEVEDEPELRPYRLCPACGQRLRARSLRPLEWFNLAAIHSPWRHQLHDNFYETHPEHYGAAYQPKEEVVEAERFPAPTLHAIIDDLELLIDFAMTVPSFDSPPGVLVVEALSRLTASGDAMPLLLASLQRRIADSQRNVFGPPNSGIESSALRLCGYCLGPFAAEWIRERWEEKNLRAESFPALANATAHCLPFEEAWERVTKQVAAWPHCIFALDSFRTPRALDWMETNRIGAVPDAWGITAAVSHFNWPRAKQWLDSGRPLSHVTIAAIQACLRHNTPLTRQLAPVLEDPAPVTEMIATLKEYAGRDPVPDVQRRVAEIVGLLARRAV